MRFLIPAFLMLAVVFPLQAQSASHQPAEDSVAKAQSALEHDHPAEAIAILQRLAQTQPAAKDLQHELGLAYYRTGELSEAKNTFAQAIAQDAADRESVQMLGLVLYRMGRPAEAIPYLERVLQWMPNANADARYVLGLCYMNAKRYDEARASFAAQFGSAPDSPGSYLLFGTMLRHAGLPELAAEQAQKAIALNPDLPLAHFMLGEVALSRWDVDKAVTEFEAEVRINPDYAPAYDRLGDAYLRQDKLDAAQIALTKAIALDTSLTGSFIKMGKVLLRKEDMQTAAMYLKHAEKMDPEDFTTHTLLAQAYHKMGHEEDAKREVALASRIHSNNQLKLDPGESTPTAQQ